MRWRRAIEVAGRLILLIVFAAMARWTWLTWPDPLIDFGRELYVPWQLLEGKRLFSDIAWFDGPLPPEVNAIWFRLLGVSLRTLVVANLAILSGTVALAFVLLRRIAGELGAIAGCLVFLLVFAFAQLVPAGNYNFVCPYAHGVTHGMLLAFAALAVLDASPRRALAAGILTGACALTKPEIAVAATLAVVAGLVVRRAPPRAWATLAAGFVLAVALVWLAFLPGHGSRGALRAIAGGWPAIASGVGGTEYYRRTMGTFDLGTEVARDALLCAEWLGAFGAVALADLVLRRGGATRFAPFAGIAAALLVLALPIPWIDVARPLPVAMAAGLAIAAMAARRGEARAIGAVPLFAFALPLLGKIALDAHVYHYGFALAMPATLLAVAAVVEWIPSALRGGRAFRAFALVMLGAFAAVHVRMTAGFVAKKKTVVGTGADAFWADSRGPMVDEILEEIARRPGSLVVLPEGVMLDYLARRENPTPYVNFMPPEIFVFGEDRMLASLRAHPPVLVAFVHKDTSDYGVRFFGADFAKDLAAWANESYAPVASVGAPPFTSPRFGIVLLERKTDE